MSKLLRGAAILADLERRIEREEWKAGGRLPSLSALAEEYGAGVSTMRESLRILESKGYVVIEQGRGTFVRSATHWRQDAPPDVGDLSAGSLSSLLEFRDLLEPEMAALAARRGSPGQIAGIKAAAERMLYNLAHHEDYFEADLAFHERIAEASANEVMQTVMRSISELLLESRRLTTRIPGSPERAAHFHMLIALAIEQRNAPLAKDTMALHLRSLREDIQQMHGSRPAAKPEFKPPESKPEFKPVPKSESKPEFKPVSKSESKPELKSESKERKDE